MSVKLARPIHGMKESSGWHVRIKAQPWREHGMRQAKIAGIGALTLAAVEAGAYANMKIKLL